MTGKRLTEKERIEILRGCGASAGFGETAKHAIEEAEKRKKKRRKKK